MDKFNSIINSYFVESIDPRFVKNPMISAAFTVIKRISNELGEDALIVGGAVRDIVMGKEPLDVDISTSASPEQIESIFKTHDIGKSKDFGIVVVKQNDFDFEIASFREDSAESDGRRPNSVKMVKDFKTDANRRDLTINALGIRADGVIVDHFGGLEDIKNNILKAVGDPRKRFEEDALRILRLIRFSAKTGFKIDPDTLAAASELSPLVDKLSAERIRDEMFKSAGSGKSLAKFIEGLDEIGLLQKILPEIYEMKGLKHNPVHHPEGATVKSMNDVENLSAYEIFNPDHNNPDKYQIIPGSALDHVLAALRASKSNNFLVNLAVLFHDIGKTITLADKGGQPTYYGHESAGVPLFKNVASRLKISNSDREAIEFAIENHMHGHNIEKLSNKLLLRLRQNANWNLLKDVIYSDEASRGDLFKPDKFNQKMSKVEDVAKKFGDKTDFEARMSKLINGKLIMDTLPEIKGPMIGRVKEFVRNWIIENDFNVTEDEIISKIQEFRDVKENNFNSLYREIIENNTAGGAMSVFGDLQPTNATFSGDNYATGDSRIPKILSKKIIRRGQPELTVFATGVIKKKGSKTKKKNNGK